MEPRSALAAALAAALICLACARAPDERERERGERLAAMEAAVELASDCAGELQSLVDEDPAAAARVLAIEPIRLAPYGGAARAPDAVREEISGRLGAARADASAARTLATLDDEPRAAELSRERATRSLAEAERLCRAAFEADAVRYEARAEAARGR
jgi:hypothetical protein